MVAMAALPVATAAPANADEEKAAETEAATETEPAEPEKIRQRNWRMRVFGAVAGDNGGFLVTSGAPHYSVAVSGGGGVGVNFEYRTSPRMGFEFGAMAVGGPVRVGVGKGHHPYAAGVGVDGYVPMTFALNFHPIKNSEIVDFYVGPLVASTFLSSVGVGPGVLVESRVEFGLGANLGVDINFGRRSRWSFGTALKYISNFDNSSGLVRRWDFDPLIFSFGFGFKF
jgi:outer membrane protein W